MFAGLAVISFLLPCPLRHFQLVRRRRAERATRAEAMCPPCLCFLKNFRPRVHVHAAIVATYILSALVVCTPGNGCHTEQMCRH